MDEELVEMIVAGQGEVFSLIYNRYYSRVYRMAYAMTGSHHSAEDMAQEVFMRAYQKITLFGGKSKFSTWLYRLAHNHCLNHCKREHVQDNMQFDEMRSSPLNTSFESAESRLLQTQVQSEIQKALLSLKPEVRLIIILRDIEGLTYAEICEQLNCSTGTLAAQLNRARKLIARKLEHLRGTI